VTAIRLLDRNSEAASLIGFVRLAVGIWSTSFRRSARVIDVDHSKRLAC
jgi:hypothetical protein